MSELTMQYGGTCATPSNAPKVGTLGRIYANNVTDPDGDNVAVQFQAKWDAGDGKGLIVRWSSGLTGYKKSGSSFAISLPTDITPGKQVQWYARVRDTDSTGAGNYSAWSYAGDPSACYFVYDRTYPKAPEITSAEYPESIYTADLTEPWYDGVGQYGSFTIDAVDTDVTTYWYGINENPTSRNKITTSGGAAEIVKALPAEPGVRFFTARAFDSAGNPGTTYTYQFRVKVGQPDRAT
jgi:hypothetical protein